jgi:hypothetical protein
MKKIPFYIAVLLLATSCTKDITSLNTDPKSSVSAPSSALFLGAQKNLADLYNSTSVASAPFRVLSQIWTENTYTTEARYQINGATGGFWSNIYTLSINNFEQAKATFPIDVKDAAVLRNDLIISDILQVYSYNLLVNTYGNVPYSEAQKRTIPFPKYDDAKTIVYDLITRLDTSIAGLNTSANSLGSADQIYKGNVAKWKKFAATLKLKLALLIADADAPKANAKALEAVAAGLIQSNTDNATFAFDASAVTNSNLIWQNLVNSGRHDFVPSALFVNTLVNWNDPRLPLFITKDPGGNYSGGIAGAGNAYGIYSDFSAQWLSPTYPADLLDYSETEFLLAEAVERGIAVGGTAEAHYNNAITASIQFWGGTVASAATYLAQPAVAYSTAAGNWKQKIGYQKWLAFANRNWDSWTEIRRLGYPNLDVVSPPSGANGKLPLRYTYPSAEQSSNVVNWDAAVKALPGGVDVAAAKLFWIK